MDIEIPIAIPEPVSKEKAKQIAKIALRNSDTAEGAARYIKEHTTFPKQGYQAHHKDHFDLNTPGYPENEDHAEQAKDDRWLIIHKSKEAQPKTLTSTPK